MASTNKANNSNSNKSAPPPMDRCIVLVGMMGVGKTSVGRRLAERLNMDFVDADDEIELASGMKISEIFDKFGEDYFRDGERRVIMRLVDGPPKIIATGGGAFINDETRTLIKEKALSIWLNADIDVLVDRVSRRSHRPLLKNKNPREVLTQLGETRNPYYAQADIHIRSDTAPHAATIDNILKAMKNDDDKR